MTIQRREFLSLASGAAMLPLLPRHAEAQTYPMRPVHLIVGFPPGGTADILARLIGQWLSTRLVQPFVIDNRPGASSNIATEAVVKAPSDGYTLLLVTAVNAVNATLYDKLAFDFVRDIAPVAGLIRSTNVMIVHPSVPARTTPEFISYANAYPGKLNMASAGIGSTAHMAGELFEEKTGIKILHIPYGGSSPRALADLLGGRVQVMFDLLASSLDYIRTGRVRALAVTTATRSAALPDIPALNEFAPGYEASAWQGVGAPRRPLLQLSSC